MRQDCLEGVAAVAARFGEGVPARGGLCAALLAEIDASGGALLKKALACLRALPCLLLPSRLRSCCWRLVWSRSCMMVSWRE